MQTEDLRILIEEIQKLGSKEQLENLLKGLLTPKEIEELAERIRIVKLLKKGIGQHDIAARLKVGVATVGRGAKEIQEGNFTTI